MTRAVPPPPRPGDPSSFQRLRTDPVVRELRVRRQPVIGAAAAAIALYLFNADLATEAPGVLAISLFICGASEKGADASHIAAAVFE